MGDELVASSSSVAGSRGGGAAGERPADTNVRACPFPLAGTRGGAGVVGSILSLLCLAVTEVVALSSSTTDALPSVRPVPASNPYLHRCNQHVDGGAAVNGEVNRQYHDNQHKPGVFFSSRGSDEGKTKGSGRMDSPESNYCSRSRAAASLPVKCTAGSRG
jgi:hypothetical protein